MSGNSKEITWEIEPVPDLHCVFLRVHENDTRDGKPLPGAFKERGITKEEIGMSTDWCKYSTPDTSKSRAKNPEKVGIVSLPVSEIKKIPAQEIKHSPIQNHPEIADNRSHTNIKGVNNTTKSRAEYMSIYEWKIIPINCK